MIQIKLKWNLVWSIFDACICVNEHCIQRFVVKSCVELIHRIQKKKKWLKETQENERIQWKFLFMDVLHFWVNDFENDSFSFNWFLFMFDALCICNFYRFVMIHQSRCIKKAKSFLLFSAQLVVIHQEQLQTFHVIRKTILMISI